VKKFRATRCTSQVQSLGCGRRWQVDMNAPWERPEWASVAMTLANVLRHRNSGQIYSIACMCVGSQLRQPLWTSRLSHPDTGTYASAWHAPWPQGLSFGRIVMSGEISLSSSELRDEDFVLLFVIRNLPNDPLVKMVNCGNLCAVKIRESHNSKVRVRT
jgi:hypothetical protein